MPAPYPAALLGAALLTLLPHLALGAGDPVLGERLYNRGLLASGQPVTGTTMGDVPFSGTELACQGCHRRSGFGSSEGGNFVPPITGSELFNPRDPDRAFMFKKLFKEAQPRRFWARVRQPRMRPAYTEASLGRALREGVDAAEHPLDPLMPRYHLPEGDLANLTAYLRTLSVGPDPGVDDTTLHFATVVSAGADPARREAMLGVIREFVEWMNEDTRGDLRNPRFSPHYRSDLIAAYRLWDWSVWELSGPRDTWGEQLRRHYARQPVFALVSGLVDGPWAPVQRFCEAERIPCLFPHTRLPVVDAEQVYSVHFNRGLTLEARVLARHLADGEEPDASPALVLHHTDPTGSVPAQAFRAAWAEAHGGQGPALHAFADADGLRAALAEMAGEGPLVAWPGDLAATLMDWLMAHPDAFARVYLPFDALATLPEGLSEELQTRLYFTFPYELPSAYHPRAFRVRAWMRSRNLEIPFPRLQFDTYYALTLVQFGLEHIVADFSRDYLLEYVEHEAENALNPGTYPRLALGPGQRFASKGAFVVQHRNDRDPRRRIVAVSDWIVP